MRTKGRQRVVVGALGILTLAGCSDPVLVGLTGSVQVPTAIIVPCRPDWFKQRSLTVTDSRSGEVLWKVAGQSPSGVDMRSVTFGTPPEGSVAITPAAPLSGHSTVQWKYEAPGTEPVQQTFTLSRVDPGSVLTTDDQHHPTADWRTCDQ